MRTDDLVLLLARDAQPVAAGAAVRRIALAIFAGWAGAAVIMAWRLGLSPEFPTAMRLPMFWVKAGFVGAILAVSAAAARRLGTPGAPTRGMLLALAAPVAVLWLIAAAVLLQAPPAERTGLVLGATWRVCAANIAMLSVPAFVAALWAMRGLAPARVRLAGGCAGLLAGATATLVYTLHCPETAPPFLAVWYLLGMLIPAAAGMALGPRVLRW